MQIPCVYDELQREAAALSEEDGPAADTEPQRPKLPTAAQRKERKFTAYAQTLAAHLAALTAGPVEGSASTLHEVALLFGTAAVAPREAFRLLLPPGDSACGVVSTAAAGRGVRRCLRALYGCPPAQLHQAHTLGLQHIHILARVSRGRAARSEGEGKCAAAGDAPLSPAEPLSVEPRAPWVPCARFNLAAACARARVARIEIGLAASEPADDVDAVTTSLAAATLEDDEEGLWLALPPLPRAIRPPSQRVKTDANGTAYC